MKEEILHRLNATLMALNNVSVKGKENLDNLGGSISILAETMDILNGCEIELIQEREEENA